MPRWFYSLSLRLMLPVAVLAFLWRGWRNAAYRGSLRERLGWSLRARNDRPLWLHAASVGEVRALNALVRAMPADMPPLLVTVGTPTGLAQARAMFADLCAATSGARAPLMLQAAPWDLPGAVRRFIRAVHPRAAVFIETELWPNLLATCVKHHVPPTLVSARLSERSLRRYQQFAPRLLRDAIRSFVSIGAQSAADKARFIALGAEAATVQVTDNLKFDLPLPADIAARGAQWRMTFAQGRPLWVAGSTHAEEEAICIEAHRALLAAARNSGRPPPCLVLAPRRPERFAEVAAWLSAQGLKTACVSRGDASNADVLLLDVMGELLPWYAAADAAFVGGSLVAVGGHNLLEPAALGKPVIAGPHCFNAPEVARVLEEADALSTVADAAQLSEVLQALLGNAELAAARGARAAAVVEANRGAATKALSLVRSSFN